MRSSVGTVGQDIAESQEGSVAAAYMLDDGDFRSRDAAERYNNKDGGGRDAVWRRRRKTRTSGDNQVDDERRIRHAR